MVKQNYKMFYLFFTGNTPESILNMVKKEAEEIKISLLASYRNIRNTNGEEDVELRTFLEEEEFDVTEHYNFLICNLSSIFSVIYDENGKFIATYDEMINFLENNRRYYNRDTKIFLRRITKQWVQENIPLWQQECA